MIITSATQPYFQAGTRAQTASGGETDSFQPSSGEAPLVNKAMLNQLFDNNLVSDKLVAWKLQLPEGSVRDNPTFGPDGTVYIPQSGGTSLIDLETGKLIKQHKFAGSAKPRRPWLPTATLFSRTRGSRATGPI